MKRGGENEESRRDRCETIARESGHALIMSNLAARLSRSRDKCWSRRTLAEGRTVGD